MGILKKYIEHETKVKYVDGLLSKSQDWEWFIDYLTANFEYNIPINSYEEFKAGFAEISEVFECLIKINKIFDLEIENSDIVQLNDIAKFYLNKIKYEDVCLSSDLYRLLMIGVLSAKIKNQLDDADEKYLIYTEFFELHNVFKFVDISEFQAEEDKFIELFDEIGIDISTQKTTFCNNINHIEHCDSQFSAKYENVLKNCDCISFGSEIKSSDCKTKEEFLLSEITRVSYQKGELIPYAVFDGVESPNFKHWTIKILDNTINYFKDDNITAIVESIKYALYQVPPSYNTIKWHIDLLYEHYHEPELDKLYCSSLEFIISFFNYSETKSLFDSNLNKLLASMFEKVDDLDFLLYVKTNGVLINKKQIKQLEESIKDAAKKVSRIDFAGEFISYVTDSKFIKMTDNDIFEMVSDKFDELVEKTDALTLSSLFYSYQIFLLKIKNNKGITHANISSEIVYIRGLWKEFYFQKCASALHTFEHTNTIPTDEVEKFNAFVLQSPLVYAAYQMKLVESKLLETLINISENPMLLLIDKITIHEEFPYKKQFFIDKAHPMELLYIEQIKELINNNGYKLLNVFKPEEFLEEVYNRIEKELQITLSLFNDTEKLFDDATKNFKTISLLPYSKDPTFGDLVQLFPLLEKRIRDIGIVYGIPPMCEEINKIHRLKEPSWILTKMINFILKETGDLKSVSDFVFIHFCMYGENGLNIRNDCVHGNGYEQKNQISFAYKLTLFCLYLIEYRFSLMESTTKKRYIKTTSE